MLTVSLETGLGWQKLSEGGESRSFEPPHALLPIRSIDLVQPSFLVLGFSGLVASTRHEFTGMFIMAFTHTMEILSDKDSCPLAFVLSPRPPTCVPDPTALLGYRMIPGGHPAYLGFGTLVPTGIADEMKT